MKRLIIPCSIFLIFGLLITRTTISLAGSNELPKEVQRILKEIKEIQGPAKASPEESFLNEKQGAQQPVDRK